MAIKYLTVLQAAYALRVGPTIISRWLKQNRFEGAKRWINGRNWMIPEKSVHNLKRKTRGQRGPDLKPRKKRGVAREHYENNTQDE